MVGWRWWWWRRRRRRRSTNDRQCRLWLKMMIGFTVLTNLIRLMHSARYYYYTTTLRCVCVCECVRYSTDATDSIWWFRTLQECQHTHKHTIKTLTKPNIRTSTTTTTAKWKWGTKWKMGFFWQDMCFCMYVCVCVFVGIQLQSDFIGGEYTKTN